jgi:hypothetical protein
VAAVLEISLPDRKGSLARSATEVSRGGFGIRHVEEVRDLIAARRLALTACECSGNFSIAAAS